MNKKHYNPPPPPKFANYVPKEATEFELHSPIPQSYQNSTVEIGSIHDLAEHVAAAKEQCKEHPPIAPASYTFPGARKSDDGRVAVVSWAGLVDSEGRSLSNDIGFLTLHTFKRDDQDWWAGDHISYWMPLDWVSRLVRATEIKVRNELDKMIEGHVSRGVERGVATAVHEKATTIEKIEHERANLEKQQAEIERRLAALQQAEQKEIERQQAKANRTPRTTAGYVYVLQSPTGAHKIGRTANPADRLRTFSVKLPFPVQYDCLIRTDDMYTLEGKLHYKFASKRVDGEWFNLSTRDLALVRRLARLAKGQTDD